MLSGVVLAAGESRRMEGYIKPLLTIQGITFLERMIMKLCKDCKHKLTVTLNDVPINTDNPKCGKAPFTDPVTGETDFYQCRLQRNSRMNEEDCGPDARHFEPINIDHIKGKE